MPDTAFEDLDYGNQILTSLSNAASSGDFGDMGGFGVLDIINDPGNSWTIDKLIKKYGYAQGGIVSLNQMPRAIGYR